MDGGLILTYQDKYYKALTQEKNDMEIAPILQNGDSYGTEMYLIQFEIHSLRNLDSICLAGTVHLEILYLHLNADLQFSPGGSWRIFRLNHWY